MSTEKSLYNDIGLKIKWLRKENGLIQEEFGKLIGKSIRTVQK